MSTNKHLSKSPEERELDFKEQQLSNQKEELAVKELELANLQTELLALQNEYLRIVGTKLAELDEIEARIAEILSKYNPGDQSARRRASEAKVKADASKYAKNYRDTHANTIHIIRDEDFNMLFREVAKAIHPDLSRNDRDRALREELMKKANEAYKEGDAEKLRMILNEWEYSPEQISGVDVASDLIRIIRIIDQLYNRIEFLDIEIEKIKNSDIFNLFTKYKAYDEQGKNLFSEMSEHIDIQIIQAKTRLLSIIKDIKQT